MILPIVQYPNPLLKKTSEPVTAIDKETRRLVNDMFETMYDAPGVGLAAPQIGLLKRILVVDIGRLEGETPRADPKVLINPTIVSQEGKITWQEGCLSLPRLVVSVERSQKIIVEAKDLDGKTVRHLGEGLLAVAFQHEIDHLNGILLADRLSRLKRNLYKKKLEKISKGESVEEEVRGKGPAYIG